jgi:hypothetical protein
MDTHQPCPKCSSQKAEKVGFTWWGGVLGPKIFNHVKCTQCGTTFNSKTGKSNQQGIIIYTAVSLVIAAVLIAAYNLLREPDRQQSPATSSLPSHSLNRLVLMTSLKVGNTLIE